MARLRLRSPEPCVYPYELTFRWGGRPSRIRGVVAEVELEPWGGSIVPHERTMPGPIEDRLSLLRASLRRRPAAIRVDLDRHSG